MAADLFGMFGSQFPRIVVRVPRHDPESVAERISLGIGHGRRYFLSVVHVGFLVDGDREGSCLRMPVDMMCFTRRRDRRIRLRRLDSVGESACFQVHLDRCHDHVQRSIVVVRVAPRACWRNPQPHS